MNRTTSHIIVLSILGCIIYTSELARAVMRSHRSVIRCDRSSSAGAPAFTDAKSCRKHCERTYVNVNREMRSINKDIFQAELRQSPDAGTIGQRVHLLHNTQQQASPECCCLFEAPWPPFVNPEAIGKGGSYAALNDKFWDKKACWPLGVTINLSRRSRESFETLCKHLSQRNPLTTLELMQFAEAAAYLNYMAPKHPAIMMVLHLKHVKRIDKEELVQLKDVLYSGLLDETYNMPIPSLPGYRLETSQIKKLMSVKRDIEKALKSSVVARAFDELAVSQLLVDVAAFDYRLQEMNIKEFRVPNNLLTGDYDKYDRDLAAYFTMPHANCVGFSKTLHKIGVYLTMLESFLGSLYGKGNFDRMAREYKPLMGIIHTKKIYENLLRVNCH